MQFSHFKLSADLCWQICFVFCLASMLLIVPDFAVAASTDDGISGTLCLVTNQLTGPIGRGVATIAVVVLGIGLFLGKLSWGLAIATALGIGMIFSAKTIVGWLSGSGTASCATS
jgi:type IV secretion system protein VirB2